MVELFADGHAGGLVFFDLGVELADFELDGFEAFADVLDVAEAELFGFPLFAEAGELFAEVLDFFLQLGAALDGVLFGFFGQLAVGQFELRDAALDDVDFAGNAFQFHGQAAGGFVDQVDGFVGQEAVGDVALRELGGGDQGGIFDLHIVVGFVAGLEAAEDGDGVVDGGLADVDGLEAAFQGGIFFDVLAVFVERGRADAAEFAAGQRGLEQVGGVGGAFGCAGADHGVQLVDEQDHVAGGVFDFAEDGFQAVFEFAAVFCAGDECAQVERDDALVFEAVGHVALDDSQGEAFGDGGFADAGFADEDRVVFGAAGEDLDDAADFLVAADDRIELALAGALDQIDAVFVQGLEFAFGGLIGDAG